VQRPVRRPSLNPRGVRRRGRRRARSATTGNQIAFQRVVHHSCPHERHRSGSAPGRGGRAPTRPARAAGPGGHGPRAGARCGGHLVNEVVQVSTPGIAWRLRPRSMCDPVRGRGAPRRWPSASSIRPGPCRGLIAIVFTSMSALGLIAECASPSTRNPPRSSLRCAELVAAPFSALDELFVRPTRS